MLQWYHYFRNLCENDSWNELTGEMFKVSEREKGIFKDNEPEGMVFVHF